MLQAARESALADNKVKTDNTLWSKDKELVRQFPDPCILPRKKPPKEGRWTVKVSCWFNQPDDAKITDKTIATVFGSAGTLSIPKSRGGNRRPNNDKCIRLSYPIRVYQLIAIGDEEWSVFSRREASHLCHNGIYGCVNKNHLVLEPKKVNMERRDLACWYGVTCIDCGGNILGNKCKGHGDDVEGCLTPNSIGNVCVCAEWVTKLSEL